MSAQRLFEVIGLVDDDLLEEAERYRTPYKESHLARWGALAACAVLVIGGAFMMRVVFGGARSGAPTGGAPAASPSAGCESPSESGGGPALPLTAEGDLEGLTAEREVTYTLDDTQLLPMGITDSYRLSNATAEDKTLKVSMDARNADGAPKLTLDGETLESGGDFTAEIIIPASATVELTASYRKGGGFKYELATTRGSALTFTAQRAGIELPPGWELVDESFGFDLAHGVKEVELDLNVESYYMEIRKTQ